MSSEYCDVIIFEFEYFVFQPPKGRLDFLADPCDYSAPFEDTCSAHVSEDCLYLSIFVPQNEDPTYLPVMVWLHEHSKDHGPDFLIDQDVIVVTVSHRVGIFGFLNTDDSFAFGNMGAKDVIVALRWVRSNIAYFNGDPNRVTVFGSGQAASIVASLLVSPAAEDLFERVIVQSGTALSPADYKGYHFEIANKLYWRLGGSFDKFDRKRLYKMLSTATTEKLLSVSQNLFDSTEMRDNQRLINSFGPSVEMPNKHFFMNKSPLEAYDRKMTNNNADVMIGYTSLESIHKLCGLAKNRKLLPCLNYNFQYLLPFEGKSDGFMTKSYRDIRRRIMDFYFLNGTITEKSFRRYAKYVADQVVYPLLRQAKLHAEVSCRNVYLYRFPFNSALNVGWRAALHNSTKISGATSGDEVCYLFKCKSIEELYTSVENAPQRHFIKTITRLWANFAKFG